MGMGYAVVHDSSMANLNGCPPAAWQAPVAPSIFLWARLTRGVGIHRRCLELVGGSWRRLGRGNWEGSYVCPSPSDELLGSRVYDLVFGSSYYSVS